MRIVALSGSVRAASSNTTLLCAAIVSAPPGVEIALFDGLLALPHFNPDRDESAPPEVLDFRGRFAAADGFLVSSPEYALSGGGSRKGSASSAAVWWCTTTFA